jgi:hypothetical protein
LDEGVAVVVDAVVVVVVVVVDVFVFVCDAAVVVVGAIEIVSEIPVFVFVTGVPIVAWVVLNSSSTMSSVSLDALRLGSARLNSWGLSVAAREQAPPGFAEQKAVIALVTTPGPVSSSRDR